MITNKNTLIYAVLIIVAIIGVYVWTSRPAHSPEPSAEPTGSPQAVESPSATSLPVKSPSQTPLTAAAPSCALKGEIKFVNGNTYDNQDALFTYSGVDAPERNIFWTISPQDDIRVGPNIFTRLPLPGGTSLLGVFMPENPKYKRYELTARIQYGRAEDNKIFEKQCDGKTVVVLP